MLTRSDSNLSTASEASTRARQLLASGGLDSLTKKPGDKKVPSSIQRSSSRSTFQKFDLYSKPNEESESTNHEELPILVTITPSPPISRIDCLSKNSRATNRARQLVNTESWKGLDEMAQLHASFCSLRATDDDSDDDEDSGLSLSSSDDDCSLLSHDEDDNDDEDILLFDKDD